MYTNEKLKKALIILAVLPLLDFVALIIIGGMASSRGYIGIGEAIASTMGRAVFSYIIRLIMLYAISKGYKWVLHVLAVFASLAALALLPTLGLFFNASPIIGLLELIILGGSIGTIIYCYSTQEITDFFNEEALERAQNKMNN